MLLLWLKHMNSVWDGGQCHLLPVPDNATGFDLGKGKLWTDTYPNNTKAQIDYILMNKKWINSALYCESYSSFESVSSDHRIVTVKIRLNLRSNAAWTTTTVHYDWSLLNNRDISDKYTITLTPNKRIWELRKCTHGSGRWIHTNQTKSKIRVPKGTLAFKKNLTTWKSLPYIIKGTQLTPMLRNLRKLKAN